MSLPQTPLNIEYIPAELGPGVLCVGIWKGNDRKTYVGRTAHMRSGLRYYDEKARKTMEARIDEWDLIPEDEWRELCEAL